jgi:hypothetical protein
MNGLEKMFIAVGQPVPIGANSTPPPSKADIAKLVAVAWSFVIEIRLPQDA